jgi:hypothetical protein
MSPRVPFALFLLSAAGAVAACKSSSPYGSPQNAAIGTGLAVGAAAINRAVTNECWAACRPGTICDKASGLCVEPGHASGHPASTAAAPSGSAPRPLPTLQATPYAPGHEYVVPPVSRSAASSSSSVEPVACDPASMQEGAYDAGPIACEPDGSLPSP